MNFTNYHDLAGDIFYQNPAKFIYTSIMFNKFPIRFGIKVAGADSVKVNKKLKWNLFLFGGVDIYTRPPIGIKIGSTSIYYTNPQFDSIIIDEDFINIGTRYILYSLGLSLKGYNKKGQNIVNFSVNYTQGRRFDYMSGTKLVLTNVDGYEYRQYLYSRGSGFYFTLSKDINPFFEKQQKIKRLLNDYK